MVNRFKRRYYRMYSAKQAAQTLMEMEWSKNWRFRERLGVQQQGNEKKSP
jgi:hypothetical protein